MKTLKIKDYIIEGFSDSVIAYQMKCSVEHVMLVREQIKLKG